MRFFLQFIGLAAVVEAACNGHDALCDRKYSEITNIGSHNSAFVGHTLSHNQFVSVAAQLDLGVRFLQARVQSKDGAAEMCHTSCLLLDEGPLADYLVQITEWIDIHPDEVISVLLTNHDALPIELFDQAFASTGLKKYVFRPKGELAKNDWPTLQEMIDAGTRVVVFMDYYSDQSKVDYILDQWDYYWETPYGITDSNFPTCAVDRPDGGDPKRLMAIMNHSLNINFLGIVFPDVAAASKTNSVKSIQAQVDLCKSMHSYQPNVVLMDWVNVGETTEAFEILNGLSVNGAARDESLIESALFAAWRWWFYMFTIWNGVAMTLDPSKLR